MACVRRLVKICRARFRELDLTSEEKILFLSAFKNNLLLKRRQWRSIYNAYDTEERN